MAFFNNDGDNAAMRDRLHFPVNPDTRNVKAIVADTTPPFHGSLQSASSQWHDQFSVKFIRQVIADRTQVGDTIVDMFCGAGTASVVAMAMGRNVIAVDRNQAAIQVTRERIQKLTSNLESGASDAGEDDIDPEDYID